MVESTKVYDPASGTTISSPQKQSVTGGALLSVTKDGKVYVPRVPPEGGSYHVGDGKAYYIPKSGEGWVQLSSSTTPTTTTEIALAQRQEATKTSGQEYTQYTQSKDVQERLQNIAIQNRLKNPEQTQTIIFPENLQSVAQIGRYAQSQGILPASVRATRTETIIETPITRNVGEPVVVTFGSVEPTKTDLFSRGMMLGQTISLSLDNWGRDIHNRFEIPVDGKKFNDAVIYGTELGFYPFKEPFRVLSLNLEKIGNYINPEGGGFLYHVPSALLTTTSKVIPKTNLDVTLFIAGSSFLSFGTTAEKVFATGVVASDVATPLIRQFDESFLYQPTSISGRIAKSGVEGVIVGNNPFFSGVFAKQFITSAITNPTETGQAYLKNWPETLGFITGAGLKFDLKLAKFKTADSFDFKKSPNAPTFVTLGKDIGGIFKLGKQAEAGYFKVTYEVPFTTKRYELINNKYLSGDTTTINVFAKEKYAYEQVYKILKKEKIEVGNLRLERLKELPKDVETLNIIKQFAKEKGLVVGGTTAIETLKIKGKQINLRRVPRDLELFDPLGRNAGSLSKQLGKRLIDAGKKIEIKGNTIGFEGIKGHGVNFQPIEGLNLERYRNKIYINPEGIKIADPISTAYNKVFDLLKQVNQRSTKAIQLKADNPEAYSKSLYDGKVYIRYPKDVVGALSTAKQVTELSLKKYGDFSNRQVPLYQEYRMARLGQAKELINPYLKKLNMEEAKIVPNYYTGKTATIFSGIKYVDSYTLYLTKQLLKDTRAISTISSAQTTSTSPFYIYSKTGKFNYPQFPLIKNEKQLEYPYSPPQNNYITTFTTKYTTTNLPKYNNTPSYPDNSYPNYNKTSYNNITTAPQYNSPKYPITIIPKLPPTTPTYYPPRTPPIDNLNRYNFLFADFKKKRKEKKQKPKGREDRALTPSFTAQILGITKTIKLKDLGKELNKFRTGGELRPVLRVIR